MRTLTSQLIHLLLSSSVTSLRSGSSYLGTAFLARTNTTAVMQLYYLSPSWLVNFHFLYQNQNLPNLITSLL